MRSFVHRFGIPKEIVSDNGTQFRSAEFAQFCQEFGIKQTFIPPFHPQCSATVKLNALLTLSNAQ
jgi:transposase InsO family protein